MNGQTVLAQWNFNGSSDTTIPGGTSSPSPSINLTNNSLQLIGGISASFAVGEGSSDTVTKAPPNYAINTTSYAASGEDKLRGIQFNISTVGYQGITFKFDQRLSGTANTTYVVQYTLDRAMATPIWIDAEVFSISPATTGASDIWFNGRTVDLSSISGLNNNPNGAIRIVSTFDTKISPPSYRAADSSKTYNSKGTVRYDMIVVSAAPYLGMGNYIYNKPSFYCYPNPIKGDIIHFNETFSVRIYDVIGKTILIADDVNELNVESLTSGLYFIENQDKVVIKLVKN